MINNTIGLMKLVIFDLGGVLVNVDPRRAVERVARETGRSPEAVERVFHDPALLEPFELGRLEPRAYFDRVRERLGVAWDFEEFVMEWNGMLSEHTRRSRLLAGLRDRYRLLILTNTNALHGECLRRWPVFRAAHYWIASHEVGLRKPDPQIYRAALQRAEVDAPSAVYVDDLDANVASARRLGIASIHCTDGMQLEDALRAAGVDVS